MVFVYARPDADTSTGSWKNHTGGAALFSAVDETSLDDADYIVSAPNTFNDVCKLSLSNVGIAGNPATVRYRYCKNNGGDATAMGLHVELLQGVAVIAEWDHDDISTSFVTAEQTLTTPQFNSITDFRDLYLSFTTAGWWLTDSSVDLDFQTGRTWNGTTTGTDFTTFLSCSRASIGYARTAAGALTSFATNTLRITDAGLLVEDARTNLCIQSQTFTAGTFVTNEITITDNFAASPDGTTTAARTVPSTSNSKHYITQSAPATVVASTAYTCSVYAKANGYDYIQINMSHPGTDDYSASFNVNTGTVGTVDATMTAEIEALANGWFRCIAKKTTAVGQISMGLVLYINNADTAGDGATYAGNGSSNVLLWGWQLEQGSFASSYIPTTTTSAVRAADSINTSGNLTTVLTALPQSVFLDCETLAAPTANRHFISSSSDFATPLQANSSNTSVGIYNGTTTLSATLGGALTFSGGVKIASAQATGQRSIVGGGGTVATDTNTAVAMVAPVFVGSDSGGSNYPYCYMRRLTCWNSKLADATLQGFTAP